MIVFPNAKINLGLSVTEKRPDGYHNLETVFYPLTDLTEALEVVTANDIKEADGTSQSDFYLKQTGRVIEGTVEDNLVLKAYRLLKETYDLPPLYVYLHKRIPSGAGLGGGSADAAFMLKLINEHFALHISDTQLEEYATRLGADCAFFIKNKPTYAEGVGNIFSPIQLSLDGYGIIVVKPDVFVSTREAFANIDPHRPKYCVRDVIARPVAEWKEWLTNDFEASVFPSHPAIREVKEELYRQGASYASMTGSGSAVFGLFTPEKVIPDIQWDKNMFCFTGRLS
jgi:4-diphosphocytidyl-2-C-methyl-D-erythritol kinase